MIAPRAPAPHDDDGHCADRAAMSGSLGCGETSFATEWQGRPLQVAVVVPGAIGARLGRVTGQCLHAGVAAMPGSDGASALPMDTFDVLTLSLGGLAGTPEVDLLEARIASTAPGPSGHAQAAIEPGALLLVRTGGTADFLTLRTSFARRDDRPRRRKVEPPYGVPDESARPAEGESEACTRALPPRRARDAAPNSKNESPVSPPRNDPAS